MTSPKRKPGRPPTGLPTKVVKTFRLAPDVAEYLAQQDNATETLERAIRVSRSFGQWRKSQPTNADP